MRWDRAQSESAAVRATVSLLYCNLCIAPLIYILCIALCSSKRPKRSTNDRWCFWNSVKPTHVRKLYESTNSRVVTKKYWANCAYLFGRSSALQIDKHFAVEWISELRRRNTSRQVRDDDRATPLRYNGVHLPAAIIRGYYVHAALINRWISHWGAVVRQCCFSRTSQLDNTSDAWLFCHIGYITDFCAWFWHMQIIMRACDT